MTTKKADQRVRKCYECAKVMIGRRENYRYGESGLSSVVLKGIIVYHCECGAIVPEILAVGNLHRSIALDLLGKASLLSAEEIRFIRKVAGYTATKLAGIMGISNEVISRWENGKANIGKESDRLFRFACFYQIHADVDAEDKNFESAWEIVKKIKELNLPQIMQNIENRQGTSKQVLINPDLLASTGEAPEAGEVAQVLQ